VSYRGRYFFGDFISNRIWSIKLAVNIDGSAAASDLVEHTGELGSGANSPSSFGEDAAGELYVVSYAGAVYRLQLVNPIEAVSGRRRPVGAPILGTAVPRGANTGTSTLSASQVAITLATVATVLAHAMPDQPELALAMRSVTMRHVNDRPLSDRPMDDARVRRRHRGHFDRGAAVPSAGADSRTVAVKTLGRRHRSAAW
jgi:hypothetical protein